VSNGTEDVGGVRAACSKDAAVSGILGPVASSADMPILPEDYELIGFFEAEPEVLDPGVPWLYNILTFATVRGELGFAVRSNLHTVNSRSA